jgi:hypothetical protein
VTSEPRQADLFNDVADVDLLRWLLADLHDDLPGKLARFRQLTDISSALGPGGTMMPGGETTYNAWIEARTSFVHGNYMATVMLCQGLAEHLLAAHLELGLGGESLPDRVRFNETVERCVLRQIITKEDAADLRRLMALRNPLSHYRNINDPVNLSRRVLDSQRPAEHHLLSDASFAISMAVRLLALPPFRLSGRTILDEDI